MLLKSSAPKPKREQEIVPFAGDEVIVQAIDLGQLLELNAFSAADQAFNLLAMSVVVPVMRRENEEVVQSPLVAVPGEFESLYTAEDWRNASTTREGRKGVDELLNVAHRISGLSTEEAKKN